MAGLTNFQKSRCPKHFTCESWDECSKCTYGKVIENQFAGSHVVCTIEPTTPEVFTVIGKDKKIIIQSLDEIKNMMEQGYRRGNVNDVFWNMDEEVPDYFKHNYDS